MIFLKKIQIKKILIERTSLDQLKRHYSFKDFLKKRIILFLIKIFYPKSDLYFSFDSNIDHALSQFTIVRYMQYCIK